MVTTLNKTLIRPLAVLSLLLLLAACGTDGADDVAGTPSPDDGGTATDGDAVRVAAVHIGVVDEANWDIAGHAAYNAMCETYGFDCTHVELVTYEAAPGVLRDFADDGYDMVITHSSGYAAAIQEVAPDYPDTEFVLFSYAEDTQGLDNYSAWSMNWDHVGFVTGVIAAAATETGRVTVVGGEEVPSSSRAVQMMQEGARYVDPDIELSAVWIGSWTDAARANELALSQIEAGSDVLIPYADLAGTGVQRAAEENGVLTIGEYVDQGEDYPDAIITSYIVDMATAYDEIGQAFVDGSLDGQIVQMGVDTGALTFTEFRNVDPAVEERVREVMGDLAAGELEIGG